MTFIVTFIALLIERFFDWSHIRQWTWYFKIERGWAQKFTGQSPYLILMLTIIPLLLALGLISFLLRGMSYGLFTLLIQLIVLLYCLGPKNLWADTFFARHSTSTKEPLSVSHIFVQANRRVFSVVFWFSILGPQGALLYRLLTLSAEEEAREGIALEVTHTARKLEVVMDWLPIRVFILIFALGGHFAEVLACWRKNFTLNLADNELLLTQCGMAALSGNEKGEDLSIEKNAISLLDRAFVILLVVLAVAVLLF